MPTAMQAVVWQGDAPYADLWFSRNTYKVGGASVAVLGFLAGYSFTGASLRMGFGDRGYLTYGPNNLILQSQTFDNASWSKTTGGVASAPVVTANTATAPDGTLTADTVVFELNGGTASGDISQLSQTPSATLSPTIYSFYARTTDGTSKVFSVVGNGGTFVSITITGSWQRFTAVEPLTGSSSARIRLRGSASGEGTATSASIYLWGAQLEAVTYQTTPSTYYPTTTAAYYGARLVYDPVTLASLGILVEEARTNICTYSQQFDNAAWTLTGATITANGATSPDGTANADRLVEDTGTSQHWAFQSPTTTAAAWTASCYIKAAGRSWAFLRLNDSGGTNRYIWFNVTTGVVGTAETGWTGSITAVGGGWYRCVGVMATAFAGVNTLIVGATNADGVASYTGNGAVALDIWQAQLELGTGASSPIPTTTASVTRAADNAILAGLTPNADTGTFMVEAQVSSIQSATWAMASLTASDAGFTDEYLLYTFGTIAAFQVRAGAATQADIQITPPVVANTTFKLAGSYALNNIQAAANGVAGTPDTSATLPITAVMPIGRRGGASAIGMRTISRIRLWNQNKPVASITS